MAPALIIIALFNIYPIFRLLDLSLQANSDFFTGSVYERGIDNYVHVLRDPLFHKALANTFRFAAIAVPVKLTLALGMSLLLHRPIRYGKWFRTVYLLPLVTSVVALSMVWRHLFHSEYGYLNGFLQLLGIQPIGWLTQPEWVLPSVMLFNIWKESSYYILFFLAALQKIDQDILLAAHADGARFRQRLAYITLPLILPTVRFAFVIAAIDACKMFDEVFTLFGNTPGPMNSAITVGYYMFSQFYGRGEYGIAAAAACFALLVFAAIAVIQIKVKKHFQKV